jgi:hypothetical protein
MPDCNLTFARANTIQLGQKGYKYKLVESLTPPDEVNELDRYIFVVRTRIGEFLSSIPTSVSDCSPEKETKNQIQCIDIKSSGLRDILRKVLQDVQGICLHEEKPSVSLDPLLQVLNCRSIY